MSIPLLRRLLMKEAVKDTAGSSGIMSINKNIAAKVEQQVQRYVNDAMRQGVDLDTLSPEQLKMIVQMNKPKPPRVIAGDSPEGRGITEALLGKQKAPVFDMEGNIIPEGSGIMGGKQIQPINMTVKERTGGMLKGKYESDKAVKELMDSGQVSKGARGMKKSKKVQDREMFQDANKRLKTDVNKIIADIKAMDPMDSMKEANSVIGRKGVYKNLTPEESKKILKDTEDHIFERDIPIDPEDMATGGRAGFKGGGLTESDYLKVKDMLNHYFDYRKSGGTLSKTKFANAFFRENNADGGVAGLLGERPGYQDGNLAQVVYPKGNFLNIRANAPTQKDYNIQATKDLVENLPGGVVRDVLAPAAAATLSVPYDAIQAYNRMEPGSGLGGFKDAFMLENPFSSLKERTIGAAGPLADRFNKEEEEDDEYDFSGIEGQTAFLPELFMLGKSVIGPAIALGKSGLSKKAIAEALIKDRLRKEAGKKLNKKFKKIITPPKYPQGSTIKTKGPRTTTRPGGDRGRNIVSGRSGDRDFSSKGPDTSSNPRGRSNRASQERGYALHGADGGLANFANGGPARQNFKMGKRAFLKAILGTGAGIAGLKSGLFGTGGKEVTKKAVTETVKSAGSTPPPYFFKLAEKIKKLGSDTTPTNDRTIAKSLKSKDGRSDYILEEDVASGDTIIKKVNKEGDEMITDVQIMELRKGEVVRGKDGKPKKTPDEYEEVTEANARIEGDVFNDPYYSDGIEIDDILREVDDIPVPKASGGIARMLGE
jgi:hypothetical protein